MARRPGMPPPSLPERVGRPVRPRRTGRAAKPALGALQHALLLTGREGRKGWLVAGASGGKNVHFRGPQAGKGLAGARSRKRMWQRGLGKCTFVPKGRPPPAYRPRCEARVRRPTTRPVAHWSGGPEGGAGYRGRAVARMCTFANARPDKGQRVRGAGNGCGKRVLGKYTFVPSELRRASGWLVGLLEPGLCPGPESAPVAGSGPIRAHRGGIEPFTPERDSS